MFEKGQLAKVFFLLESQFCIKKHDPMITRYPSFNQVQHWCQVNHSSQWDMYQYDWGKTSTSFGQCPDYPSPTPARDLGTLFTFRKISKSICAGSPPRTLIWGIPKRKGVLFWEVLPESHAKETATTRLHFCRALNLKIRKELPEGKDVSRFFLSLWSLVFLPFGKSPSIYQKSH